MKQVLIILSILAIAIAIASCDGKSQKGADLEVGHFLDLAVPSGPLSDNIFGRYKITSNISVADCGSFGNELFKPLASSRVYGWYFDLKKENGKCAIYNSAGNNISESWDYNGITIPGYILQCGSDGSKHKVAATIGPFKHPVSESGACDIDGIGEAVYDFSDSGSLSGKTAMSFVINSCQDSGAEKTRTIFEKCVVTVSLSGQKIGDDEVPERGLPQRPDSASGVRLPIGRDGGVDGALLPSRPE